MKKMKEGHKIAMEKSLDEYKSELAQKDEKIQKMEEEIEKDGNVDKIAKILFANEMEEMKDKESKSLANAKKFELKWAEAKEEIANLQVVKMNLK
jgi:membrane-anchored protein YejM (alkaline phosphatase superfamily)